jgi:hypothetical protein
MKHVFCLLLCSLAAAVCLAEEPAPQDLAFFESKVRPLLVKHCYECHAEGAKKLGGKLRLDTRDAWQKGGESGAPIVPRKPDDSLLIKAVRYDGLEMPPDGRLPETDVAILVDWIKRGAPDPRIGKPSTVERPWNEVFAERSKWWSLQPVQPTATPAVKNTAWPRDDVDRFLLAKMEAAGLSPSSPADRRTLARRTYLVLTGLPPSPDEVEQFAADISPQAFEMLVERILSSPQFGERWARHWLDVVRFSETHGNEWNYDVHFAWRYRDYLVRALNDDVPYDQLVREHIAGDLLPQPRFNAAEQFNESVIGTAFWRFGEANHDSCLDFQGIGFDIVDNQVDTFSKAFQATTVACARCHDHKMDAVSQRDYYSLLAVLRNCRPAAHTIDGPEVNRSERAELKRLKHEIRTELAVLWKRDAEQLAAPSEKWTKALTLEKPPMESPAGFWRALMDKEHDQPDMAVRWREVAAKYATDSKLRTGFNKANLVPLADFRQGDFQTWQADGHGLRDGAVACGDFVVAPADNLVKSILPAGAATHALSEKLNGALRSPSLAGNPHKKISFRVAGDHGAAVRLVVNNCQLNYTTYRVLHSGTWNWVTFAIPDKSSELGLYAELMTFWDNPKFPDPLGTLGGDKAVHREPFDKEAQDPRTWWAITQAVLHDGDPPQDDMTWLAPLFTSEPPTDAGEAHLRFASAAAKAIEAWASGRTTDDDVRWLNWLLEAGLLSNAAGTSPKLAGLMAQYRTTEARLTLPRVIPGLADGNEGLEQTLYIRGDSTKPGDKVSRRYLEVLHSNNFGSGSGRRELAESIASPTNPLTARVMVNRLWQQVFGAGLIRTPDDFGHMGDLPSHPKLLDRLATDFVADGWSMKRMIRRLVLSSAFQQASAPSIAARQTDPDNLLLSHFTPRRLEAEAIRDSLLAVSGRLDARLSGPSIYPFRDKADNEKRLYVGPLDGAGRRSLYIKVQLMEQAPFLGAFNLPDGKTTTGRRDVTNVPGQSLALLNDPLVAAQAKVWAESLVQRNDASLEDRVDHMFRTALGRPPRESERTRLVELIQQLAAQRGIAEPLKSVEVWQDAAHALFNTVEFLFIP